MDSGTGLRGALVPIWHHFGTPLAVAIISLPFAALLIWFLVVRRRRGGMDARRALRFSVAEVCIVVGTVPWVWMILTPDPGHERGRNLIPFHDLANQVHVGRAFAAVQIGGNLLVFAAAGFFLPIRFPIGPTFVLVVGVVCSTTVETLQWVLRLGRFSSVDDVIVNAAGALIAALLSYPWWRRNTGRTDRGEDGDAATRLTWAGYDRSAHLRSRPSRR